MRRRHEPGTSEYKPVTRLRLRVWICCFFPCFFLLFLPFFFFTNFLLPPRNVAIVSLSCFRYGTYVFRTDSICHCLRAACIGLSGQQDCAHPAVLIYLLPVSVAQSDSRSPSNVCSFKSTHSIMCIISHSQSLPLSASTHVVQILETGLKQEAAPQVKINI